MQVIDQELRTLIERGHSRGYLTFDEVGAFLPDEGDGPERLDQLLSGLDEHGIQLVDGADRRQATAPADEDNLAAARAQEPPSRASRPSDDPVRTYLSQMAELPLLPREQEIALAKKIEITRKRVPLGSARQLRRAVGGVFRLAKSSGRFAAVRSVHQNQLDRTVDQAANSAAHAAQSADAGHGHDGGAG